MIKGGRDMVMDEGEIDEILKKVEIQIEPEDIKPKAPETKTKPKGKGKGKPKPRSPSKAIEGKTKRPSLNQCCNDPTAKAIDSLVKNVLNKTALQHRKKLTKTDMSEAKLGGSLIYSLMYYAPEGLKLEHPLVVVCTALGGLGIKVFEYQNTAIPGGKP